MADAWQHWAETVLARYAVPFQGPLVSLGNHGGFSGARLWRVNAPAGAFCLKAWPDGGRSPADLSWIHALLAKGRHFPWLPHIVNTASEESHVELAGRLWDLQSWMPGAADFASQPSGTRLRAACTALAELHQVWAEGATATGVCPAVMRRWDSWLRWQQLRRAGWQPAWRHADPHGAVAQSLWSLTIAQIDDVPRLLTPWLAHTWPLQPCICDLWHDHVLFQGDTVSGLIDFGSAKVDHVAVDLSRLLGSLVGSDPAQWDVGLAAYHQIRPISAMERSLALHLDRSGAILAATHWLRWLYHDMRVFENPHAVTRRLAHLVNRLREFESQPITRQGPHCA